MASPDKNDFQLDLTFTGKDRDYARPIGIVVAVLGIVFIIATMTTGLAARILPMSDEYLQVLVPRAADGKEPLALKSLEQTTTDYTLTVNGTVQNRTEFPVKNIVAVVDGWDAKYVYQKAEAALTPAEVPSQETATFQATLSFSGQPAGYKVTFRVVEGPVVSHKDERPVPVADPTVQPPQITITPKK